jgi:hypothetical protein
MARPQGDRASRTGRATGEGKIRATISKKSQPCSMAKVNLGTQKLYLLVNLLQPFVEGRSNIDRLIFRQLCQFALMVWEKLFKLSQGVGGSNGGSSERTREVKLVEQWVINFIIVSLNNLISDGLPFAIAIEKYSCSL